MKANQTVNENGSVLVTTMMTMTILAMICATSLYIAAQNSGTGMQTAGWQQALTAAESGCRCRCSGSKCHPNSHHEFPLE